MRNAPFSGSEERHLLGVLADVDETTSSRQLRAKPTDVQVALDDGDIGESDT
jgi:hypothetical protein